MMTETQIQFLRGLAGKSPELIGLLAEHQMYNKGEILPHVFMGDLTRWLLSVCEDPHRAPEVENVLDFLDNEFERDEGDIQEVISVSFLENLFGC